MAVLVLMLGFGCAHPQPMSAAAALDCRPAFPYAEGWLGGDAAYSVALDAELEIDAEMHSTQRRTLWLFGDSFIGTPGATDRVGSKFVHNSIGISRCGDLGFEIDYAWSETDDGSATAFFEHPRAHEGNAAPYWWLFDGFRLDGELYVGLLEVTPAPPRGPLGLPFRMTGMHMARVANPEASPEIWHIEITRLSASLDAFPAAAMQRQGDHVYFYAFTPLREGRQQRILTRLSVDAISRWDGDLSDEFETLLGDGQWAPGIRADRARVMMNDNATEMSIDPIASEGRFIAVYGAPIQIDDEGDVQPDSSAPSSAVYFRSAPGLAGPWSERSVILRIPELSEPEEPGTICYAAKHHARFAPPGALFLTYVCNLYATAGEDPYTVLERLQRNMDLYRPIGVILPLPGD